MTTDPISPELRAAIERAAVAAFTEEDFCAFSSSDRERVLALCDRAAVNAAALAVEDQQRLVCADCGDEVDPDPSVPGWALHCICDDMKPHRTLTRAQFEHDRRERERRERT